MSCKRLLRVSFLTIAATLAVSPAAADNEGYAINRFEPAERGSDWFTQDSLNIQGHPRLAAGFTIDWAHKPLVLYDANGDEAAAIVKDQVYAHLGASLSLFERVRLGISMPVVLYTGGDGGVFNGTTFDAQQGTTVGDLRLGGDVLIWGKYRSPFSVGAGVSVWIPTGSQAAYTGDGKVRVSPHALVAGDISMFAYAARLAFDYRAQTQTFADAEVGSELSLGASAGVRLLDKKLLLGPELTLTTSVAAKDSFFSRATTPFELIFGAHYEFLRDFRVGAGFGPGLSRGIGTPEYRGLLSFDWIQHVEERDSADEPDRDNDGISDRKDACPDDPGEPNRKRKLNGCPADNDGDGILDVEDACPNEDGVYSNDPERNGCAGDDKDGDKVLDLEDACPTIKGKPHRDPNKNGCPGARVESGQIYITERVEFEVGSATLQRSADKVLDGVLEVLNDRPDITKLSIEGHTDDRGDDDSNKELSQRRAESVKQWLVAHGIKESRLTTAGYGEEHPIDTNLTDLGRQNNRRVEFHIIEVDGEEVASEGSKHKGAQQ